MARWTREGEQWFADGKLIPDARVPQSVKAGWETMMGGRTTPQTRMGMSIRVAAPGASMTMTESESGLDKLYATPVGLLTGKTVLTEEGQPWPDPRMPLRDALAQGGIVATDKAAGEIANSFGAERNLQILQRAGQQVLPANIPRGAFEMLKDITINPAERYFKAKVDPKYAGYEHAKAGIISYVRDLARAGRINQSELNLIVDRLNNAQTYPALQSAVDTARQILREDRQGLVKAGRFKQPIPPIESKGGVRSSVPIPKGATIGPPIGR